MFCRATEGLLATDSPARDDVSRDARPRTAKRRGRSFLDRLRRRPAAVSLFFLLPVGLLASFYATFGTVDEDYEFEPRYPAPYGAYNVDAEETPDGYLVWSPKCRMLSKEPMDPSIRAYVKRERFEKCSIEPPLTGLSREENGSVVLFVDRAAAARYPGLECCWSAVRRAEKQKSRRKRKLNVDSSIVVKRCERFEGEARLPAEAFAAMVSCTAATAAKGRRGKPIYENVHAILDPDKVRDRLRSARGANRTAGSLALSRKLSVLILGIDSVSRLNFMRSAPTTDRYLRETGWVGMNGYNKMGDNTFPNVMAILTGQSQAQAISTCKPTVPYSLDRCPFLWHEFRNAGYATAYGEDETSLNTFNYLKIGFVEPPTDYYLRPYMLACEKLLKVKRRFGLKYCTGPETSFDRILDYAVEFARTFLGSPYFGLFWTISVSHENANGLSSMDGRLLDKLRRLERDGVLNDTMVVFLSDHGMRWGPIRNTFVGWYEERLPFLYLWLPEWYREERPEAYPALLANQHRLVSPFDLYETLRDALGQSGGRANPSAGCPGCRSLIAGPLPRDRGCSDAGISSHWCACTAFASADPRDPLIERGARVFLEHVDAVLDGYRDRKGERLCAKLRVKKLHRVDRLIDFTDTADLVYLYMIQVSPGDGRFEVTARYHANGTYTVSDHEVSRLNPYAAHADCLDRGMKMYCHCLK